MGWTDDNGKKIDRLINEDIQNIQTFEYAFFAFTFGKMSDFDRTSLLMKIQEMQDKNDYNILELMDYMLARDIDFKLHYKWFGKKFVPNMKAFFLIQKFRLQIWAWKTKNSIVRFLQ